MPFVIRGEGFILESCEIGQEGKELEFETYQEALNALDLIQLPQRDADLEILELTACEECHGQGGIIISIDEGIVADCPICNGRGKVEEE
ncbi:hypothetical protein COO03_12005 [Bacillus sp. AFS098217]|uniref:hypothetical protein n=1 Tax=unclassified Bacillus (in: firmicutes) TaxID=185979 RepID=UPI000BEB3797|nr:MULTISPECIES: hypothetical protein [unclassified Bacillus (in: firmicutes)]PEB52499.1 hypothetical protein COO03_12005 [Bacillus sp. AFS098217]PEU16780.1 hypothetical protein CN524_03370 [Bacillus sp. AFS019443]